MEENKKTEEVKFEKVQDSGIKKENKKTSKGVIIGIILIVLIAIVAIIVVAGINIYNFIYPTPSVQIERSLEIVTNENSDEIIQVLQSTSLIEGDINSDGLQIFVGELEYKILSEEITGETALVELEITNKDFGKAFENVVTEVFTKAISGEEVTEQMISDIFYAELSDENLGTLTEINKVQLTKNEGIWTITDPNFVYYLLPGLQNVVEQLSAMQ